MMDTYTYLIKLSKLIAVNETVDLDKLGAIIDLNNEFYINRIDNMIEHRLHE